MMNATDRAHPVRLPGYKLQLTRVNQIPVSGIIKDTIRLERYNVIEADVVKSGQRIGNSQSPNISRCPGNLLFVS
jgi:hypothetical protein